MVVIIFLDFVYTFNYFAIVIVIINLLIIIDCAKLN